jgi:DNA-binding NarL/FixJ family response regulator
MNQEPQAKPIRLVIVEDQKEVREGLRYLLGLDRRIHVVRTFDRAEGLLEYLAEAPRPDLVLMDIGLPGMSGIEATRTLRKAIPDINIIILTVFEDEEKLLASIRAGANGYILKNTKPETLLEQYHQLRHGRVPDKPAVARRLLDEIKNRDGGEDRVDYGLTPREKVILKDAADGLTYKEIAEKNHIAAPPPRSTSCTSTRNWM